MQSVSFSINSLKEFSKKRNEPQWLFEYRKKNEEFFELEKIKKSPYYDLSVAKKLLITPAGIKSVLPDGIEKDGVKVFSWETALKKFEKQIKQALESEIEPKDQFEAFINAWFNDGFVLVVESTAVKEVIVFESVFESTNVAKILVIVQGTAGEIKILEKVRGKERLLLNETLFVGEQNRVFLLRSIENSAQSQVLLYSQAILQRDAFLQSSNGWLEGSFLRSNTFNVLAGQGSKVEQLDFLLLGQKQIFDINNSAVHIATDSNSFTQLHAVLFGMARNVFDGMIKILPSGQRTNALLQAHSMLLSTTSSSNNIPGLEIEADDVKATHSASVAQILEEQVFYLQSRGIKKEIAKQLIVTSFLESIILKLPKEFGEYAFALLEKKMAKGIIEGTANA